MICGDINGDLLKREKDQNVKSYVDKLLSCNFKPILTLSTRFTDRLFINRSHYYFDYKKSKLNAMQIILGNFQMTAFQIMFQAFF